MPECGQQPCAPSQQFPWQPSHPASSLQCQKIKQDDTAAPQKKKKKSPPKTRRTCLLLSPTPNCWPLLPGSHPVFLQAVWACPCTGRSRKHCTLKTASQFRQMLEGWEAGKWLLRELGAWPSLDVGQVPPCFLPGQPGGLAVRVGNITGQGI